MNADDVLGPTLTVESVHRPAQQVAPIIVHLSTVRNYADLELSSRALLAAGETRDRIHMIRVARDEHDDRAVVYLYRD